MHFNDRTYLIDCEESFYIQNVKCPNVSAADWPVVLGVEEEVGADDGDTDCHSQQDQEHWEHKLVNTTDEIFSLNSPKSIKPYT